MPIPGFFDPLFPTEPPVPCTLVPQAIQLSERYIEELALNLTGMIDRNEISMTTGNNNADFIERVASFVVAGGVDLSAVLLALSVLTIDEHNLLATPVEDPDKFTISHDLCGILDNCYGDVETTLAKSNGLVTLFFKFTKGRPDATS